MRQTLCRQPVLRPKAGLHNATQELWPAKPDDLRRVLADLAGIEDLPGMLDEYGLIGGCNGRPEPLGGLLRRSAGARVNLLVVNGVQSEPRLASHCRLLVDATEAVAAGARAVANYLSLRHATLLVSAAQPLPANTARLLRQYRVRTVPLRTTFPGDAEPIVLRRLFDRRLLPGQSGLQARCLMLPTDAVWRIGMALLGRKPVVLQPITIAGDCLERGYQGVYWASVGLTISGLIQWLGCRGGLLAHPRTIVLGGPMTGSAVTDPQRMIVDSTTQGVLFTHHARQTSNHGMYSVRLVHIWLSGGHRSCGDSRRIRGRSSARPGCAVGGQVHRLWCVQLCLSVASAVGAGGRGRQRRRRLNQRCARSRRRSSAEGSGDICDMRSCFPTIQPNCPTRFNSQDDRPITIPAVAAISSDRQGFRLISDAGPVSSAMASRRALASCGLSPEWRVLLSTG